MNFEIVSRTPCLLKSPAVKTTPFEAKFSTDLLNSFRVNSSLMRWQLVIRAFLSSFSTLSFLTRRYWLDRLLQMTDKMAMIWFLQGACSRESLSISNTVSKNFLVKGKQKLGDSLIISAINERMKSILLSAWLFFYSSLERRMKEVIILFCMSVSLRKRAEWPLAKRSFMVLSWSQNSGSEADFISLTSLWNSFSALSSSDYRSSLLFSSMSRGVSSSSYMEVSTDQDQRMQLLIVF